jgi:hypothetical protein
MKIAAGCFGCLAFVFLALTLSWGMIYASIVAASPEMASDMAPFSGFVQYANGGCCCLSAGLAIVLLVAGSMGKKPDEME